MSESLYIIIPAYNEEANIDKVIEHWYPVIEAHNGEGRSRLVIIDDGSKDNTLALVQEQVRKRQYLEIITKDNGGHGSSIYFGYHYAIQENADWIFQTDSDGQTMAEEFESFWQARESADVIIGNRRHRGDGYARRFVGMVVRTIVGILFHVVVEDTNTPYRLMNRAALSKALEYVPAEYNLTNIALTGIWAKQAKAGELKLRFLPISFKPRQGGKNSINLVKIVRIGIKAVSDLHVIASTIAGANASTNEVPTHVPNQEDES